MQPFIVPKWKRILDLTISGVGIIALAPVMLTIAAFIRFSGIRDIIYRQQRLGIGMEPFQMYKFRSMTNERDDEGNLLPDDQRLTRIGQWIRRWSLDELPQLFNVWEGTMSLVGPRPQLARYTRDIDVCGVRRFETLPGITGWAQINGRNALSWQKKFEHDVWYVSHRSFTLDLLILFKTFLTIIDRAGIEKQEEDEPPPEPMKE